MSKTAITDNGFEGNQLTSLRVMGVYSEKTGCGADNEMFTSIFICQVFH